MHEAPLSDVTAAELQELGHRPADDPMYDAYPVTPEAASYVSSHSRDPLRLEELDYFLECDAEM